MKCSLLHGTSISLVKMGLKKAKYHLQYFCFYCSGGNFTRRLKFTPHSRMGSGLAFLDAPRRVALINEMLPSDETQITQHMQVGLTERLSLSCIHCGRHPAAVHPSYTSATLLVAGTVSEDPNDASCRSS